MANITNYLLPIFEQALEENNFDIDDLFEKAKAKKRELYNQTKLGTYAVPTSKQKVLDQYKKFVASQRSKSPEEYTKYIKERIDNPNLPQQEGWNKPLKGTPLEASGMGKLKNVPVTNLRIAEKNLTPNQLKQWRAYTRKQQRKVKYDRKFKESRKVNPETGEFEYDPTVKQTALGKKYLSKNIRRSITQGAYAKLTPDEKGKYLDFERRADTMGQLIKENPDILFKNPKTVKLLSTAVDPQTGEIYSKTPTFTDIKKRRAFEVEHIDPVVGGQTEGRGSFLRNLQLTPEPVHRNFKNNAEVFLNNNYFNKDKKKEVKAIIDKAKELKVELRVQDVGKVGYKPNYTSFADKADDIFSTYIDPKTIKTYNKILKQRGSALPGVLGATAILGTAGIGATKAFGNEIKQLTKDDQIPALGSDVEFGDPDTWDMKIPQFIEEYPVLSSVAGGTAVTGGALTTQKGRDIGKSIVRNFPLAFNPLTAAGLTYAFRPEEGYDFSDPLTRAGFEAEAAFSKDLVRASQQAARKIPASNPLLRRGIQSIANLGLTPGMALRAARVATPLGLLSLGAEGAYQLYNLAQEEQARIDAMTPEQQQEFFAEQEEISRFSASVGGRVGFEDGGPTDPSKRKFLKRSGGILGLLTAAGTGLLKLAPQAAKEVQQVASNFSSINVPVIVEELYTSIKKLGKMTDYGKKGDVKYEFGPYKMEEGPGGYEITKTNDMGEYGYSEEFFGVYKDPETGFIQYEEMTVKPDMDGKLKDVDYGVDAQTYRDIGSDLSKATGEDVYKVIAEEDIKAVLDDGGYIMDEGVLKSGK